MWTDTTRAHHARAGLTLPRWGGCRSSPDGIAICQVGGVDSHRAERAATMSKDTMIGVELAEHVCQVHGASMAGRVQFRKKLSRSHFRRFMAEQAPAVA